MGQPKQQRKAKGKKAVVVVNDDPQQDSDCWSDPEVLGELVVRNKT